MNDNSLQTETPSIYHEEDKNKKGRRFLLVFSIAFITVVAAMSGIYIYQVLFKGPKKISLTGTPTGVQVPGINKVIQSGLNQYSKDVNLNNLNKFNSFITQLTDKSMFLDEAQYSFTVSGYVLEVQDINEASEVEKFVKRITLKSNLEQNLTYILTDQELNRAIVYLETNTDSQRVAFSEIKPDDTISLKVRGDIIGSEPQQITIRITKSSAN